MMSHEEARGVIELAACGALDAARDRAFSAHVTTCPECARELESLRDLTSAIERLPTPMPRAAVVENVRRLVHLDLAGEADDRLSTLVVVFLLFFSWTVTWLTVAVARFVSGGQLGLMSLVSGEGLGWSAAYLLSAWAGGGVAVVLLAFGFRKSKSRSFA